jgi:hypothetical protein
MTEENPATEEAITTLAMPLLFVIAESALKTPVPDTLVKTTVIFCKAVPFPSRTCALSVIEEFASATKFAGDSLTTDGTPVSVPGGALELRVPSPLPPQPMNAKAKVKTAMDKKNLFII